MDLNLSGKTVTQSMAMVRQALSEVSEEIVVRTDNETVKLNLLSQLTKLGRRGKADRQGPYHIITIRASKEKLPPQPGTGAEAGARTSPREKLAFPAQEISNDDIIQANHNRPSRRTLREVAMAQAAQVRANMRGQEPVEAPPEFSTKRTNEEAPTRAKACWLVIQTDQIGNREVGLGCDLLADLLDGIDPKTYVGIFLVHRGVRLLDPAYQNGRFLRILTRKNLKLLACGKSLAYYDLSGKTEVKTAPFKEVLTLGINHDLVWI